MQYILSPPGPGVKPAPDECARRAGQPTYSPIPHELIEDRRLIGTDVRLVGVILKYARAKAEAWPAVATLARDLGCCPRTVQYSLRRLEAAGWIATREADNRTGRVLVLTWRAQVVAPPPVQPYSQGLPKAVAPQWKNQGKEKVSAPPPEPRGPADTRRRAPDRPLSPDQAMAQYADCGWLDLPASHPLRRIAEKRLAELMGGAGGPS